MHGRAVSMIAAAMGAAAQPRSSGRRPAAFVDARGVVVSLSGYSP